MELISKNWWKVLIIVLTALAARVLLLQLLPLRSSSTFELPPSVFSQAIGMVPTAAIVVTTAYAVIALVLLNVQKNLRGGRFARAVRCGLPFSLLWLMGVLEAAPALGKSLAPEFLIGVTDIIPVLLIGVLISLWVSGDERPPQSVLPRGPDVLVIASIYLVGRYLAYAVVHVNSGYSTRPEATFWWTLAMGLAVGVAYSFQASVRLPPRFSGSARGYGEAEAQNLCSRPSATSRTWLFLFLAPIGKYRNFSLKNTELHCQLRHAILPKQITDVDYPHSAKSRIAR